jgi:hypothetical protein
VTKDAKLQYEQNLTNLPIAVVILRAASNDIEDVQPLIEPLLTALPPVPDGRGAAIIVAAQGDHPYPLIELDRNFRLSRNHVETRD